MGRPSGFRSFSLSDNGLSGDGNEDSTTALQRAVDGGGLIFAPKGTYLTEQITVSVDCVIYGEGIGTTSFDQFTSGTVTDTFSVNAGVNFQVRDCSVWEGGVLGSMTDYGLFVTPTERTAAGIEKAIAIANATAQQNIVLLEGAVYNLEKTIEVPTSGARIWGVGPNLSYLLLDAGANDHCINVAGTSAQDFELMNLTIDGSAEGQTATTTPGGGAPIQYNGINFSGTVANCNITKCVIGNVYSIGISHGASSGHFDYAKIDSCYISGTGSHGIEQDDHTDSGDDQRCSISNVWIQGVGTVGELDSTADCIHITGEAILSNIRCELATTSGLTGAGINLGVIDTEGHDGGKVTLTNFRITDKDVVSGWGTQVKGLVVGGSDNVISNGYIKLEGASSTLLEVQGSGTTNPPNPAVDEGVAYNNIISNVVFDDGKWCRVLANAQNTEFHNCIFRDQAGAGSAGLEIHGFDTLVKNCTFLDQADAIDVKSTATETEINGCTFRDQTDDAIEVNGDDTKITGCTFVGQTDDAVNIISTAANTVVCGNTFRDVGGVGILDGGTSTVWWEPHNYFENVTGFNVDILAGTEYGGTVNSMRTVASHATAIAVIGADKVLSVTGPTTITNISGGTAGQILMIVWAASATFDISHAAGSAGQIHLASAQAASAHSGGAEFVLNSAKDTITLISDGTDWNEVARSSND